MAVNCSKIFTVTDASQIRQSPLPSWSIFLDQNEVNLKKGVQKTGPIFTSIMAITYSKIFTVTDAIQIGVNFKRGVRVCEPNRRKLFKGSSQARTRFNECKMAANYSKIFTVIDAITHEPFTIVVETITPIGGETLVVIKTLEGKYDTREEFDDAREYTIKGWERGYTRDKEDVKLCRSMTLKIPGTRILIDSLNEAFQAYEEEHND